MTSPDLDSLIFASGSFASAFVGLALLNLLAEVKAGDIYRVASLEISTLAGLSDDVRFVWSVFIC